MGFDVERWCATETYRVVIVSPTLPSKNGEVQQLSVEKTHRRNQWHGQHNNLRRTATLYMIAADSGLWSIHHTSPIKKAQLAWVGATQQRARVRTVSYRRRAEARTK